MNEYRINKLIFNKIYEKGNNEYFINREKTLFLKMFSSVEMFDRDCYITNLMYPNLIKGCIVSKKEFGMIQSFNDSMWHSSKKCSPFMLGKLLASFHTSVKQKQIKSHLSDRDTFSERWVKFVDNFNWFLREKNKYYNEFFFSFLYFKKSKKNIFDEYKNSKKVVIHGDYGLRNIFFQKGSYYLFDFERARIGVPFEDMIKIGYRNLNNKADYEQFVLGYKTVCEYSLGTPLLDQYLCFNEGLGIIDYATKTKDMEFYIEGLELLRKVKKSIENNCNHGWPWKES